MSRDTALLFLTLQTEANLPSYVARALGKQTNEFVCKMVLDGVLEIELDGRMICGPAAHELLGGFQPREPNGIVSALSRSALEYAAALEIRDVPTVASRLYAFNHGPVSSRWHRLLSYDSSVLRYLRIGVSTTRRRSWISWNRDAFARSPCTGRIYKLYVSPAHEVLQDALYRTIQIVLRSAAFQWKIGSDAEGLLRPDKFIAYFYELADLREAAAMIMESLTDCPVQGVPFSAELTPSGLVSWGVDPRLGTDPSVYAWGTSWRQIICSRLAAALVLAKSEANLKVSPVHFAIGRLHLEGIDTSTWTPTDSLAWA